MKRLWRIILTASTLLSLLLGAATVALWARSHWISEEIRVGFWHYHQHPRYPSVLSGQSATLIRYPGGSQITLYRDACVGSITGPHRAGPGENGQRCMYHRYAVTEAKPPSAQKSQFGFHRTTTLYAHQFWISDAWPLLLCSILPIYALTRRFTRTRQTHHRGFEVATPAPPPPPSSQPANPPYILTHL